MVWVIPSQWLRQAQYDESIPALCSFAEQRQERKLLVFVVFISKSQINSFQRVVKISFSFTGEAE